MDNCIFCKIINGDIPSKKVYENEFVYAFEDINPLAPVHILVIPKIHIENINEIDESNSIYACECIKAIKDIAKMLDVDKSGYRIISNCGENAGQTVFHLHFHLLAGAKFNEKLI